MVALNQLTTGSGASGGQPGASTVKRRKKSAAAPNPKKMFEEVGTDVPPSRPAQVWVWGFEKSHCTDVDLLSFQAQMVRRVKAYLSHMRVVRDEEKLHTLSLQCEPAGAPPGSNPPHRHKRHPSPTLSTTSSASSVSSASAGEGRRSAAPKFGTASPQAVRKMLALSEPGKTRPRPHQPRHPGASVAAVAGGIPSGFSPGALRRGTELAGSLAGSLAGMVARASHERSHSDTPAVRLSAESSSVTSLSNLPLRKTLTSGTST